MILLSVDPGTYESGMVVIDTETEAILDSGKINNDVLLARFRAITNEYDACVMEDIQYFGQVTGSDTYITLKWAGRFQEALHPIETTFLYRKTIVTEVAGSPKAKDSHVRQAVIDHYGGDLIAVGGKKCPHCKGKGWRGIGRPPCEDCGATGFEYQPGPLFNIKNDMWSAMAIALCYVAKSRRGDYGEDAEVCSRPV